MLVERLKFDPTRVAGVTIDAALPKGIEEPCGVMIDDQEDLAPHFKAVGRLVDFISSRQIGT